MFVQLQNDLKIVRTLKMYFYKLFLKIFFYPFNTNLGYGNQRRLFYGNLLGMFLLLYFETRSMKLLPLFTGNLPAMFSDFEFCIFSEIITAVLKLVVLCFSLLNSPGVVFL